jgi:hypothetical protein
MAPQAWLVPIKELFGKNQENDQEVKLLHTGPAPWLSTFCHDNCGLTLWNFKQALS